ncbi:hypothetical protein JCM15124A_12040 [Prevotella falsenii]
MLYASLWLTALAVSFTFWGVLDYGDTADFKTAYSLSDFLSDGAVMAAFLCVSLLFNHLFIRLFQPLHHYRSKLFLYAVMLLATNTLAAILLTKGMVLIWGELPRQEYIKTVYLFSLVATFISGIHASIYFQEKYKKATEEQHRLEIENIRQREINLQNSLMALKTQVDPHFLFNNFSILADLIDESRDEARAFLDNLSRVYRYKLVNMNAHLVSLESELRMLRSYVRLVETRFGTAIHVAFPSQDEIASVQTLGVPPLVVQLLVENAIKHNAHSTARPLRVNIRIEGQQVVVSNPIQPLSSAVESTGIGLSNLRERYRLLSDAQPTVCNDGHHFTVTLPLIKI